jgi:uncharacterized protein (DUF1499 family)
MRNVIGLVAAAAFVIGPTLATLGLVAPLAGFALFGLGGLLALIVGAVSAVQAARGRGLGAGGAAALAVALVFLGIASRGAGSPRINDFTTDLADPPGFKHAATLPQNRGRDLAYPPAFADVQRACCADLKPAVLPAGRDAMARAREVAESMPSWQVTATDLQAGTIEAVATSRLFHFQDDIVIRVRPEADGSSRVDMRSKSRDGKGDMGVNARRIRDYIAAVSR